jgi:hypothetical protein
MYTYIQTYMHTYVRTYIQMVTSTTSWLRLELMYTYIQTYMHTYVRAYIQMVTSITSWLRLELISALVLSVGALWSVAAYNVFAKALTDEGKCGRITCMYVCMLLHGLWLHTMSLLKHSQMKVQSSIPCVCVCVCVYVHMYACRCAVYGWIQWFCQSTHG